MKRVGWGLLLCLAAVPLAAQAPRSPHDAQPERPTVATHAGTVAPGWFELETGVERDRVDARAVSLATPTTLKFGLTGNMQLGVVLTTIRPTASAPTALGDAAVDVKWRLLDDAPLIGDFAVQPGIKLPTGLLARGTGTGTTDFSLLAISSHELGPVSLDINVGYTRRTHGAAAGNAALWTVSTGTSLTGPWAWDAEVFGYPGFSALPAVGFLTGPTYTMHPWFVADAGMIANVSGTQPPALYAGLTWNVGRLW